MTATTYDEGLFTVLEGGVLTITFDRPQQGNPISSEAGQRLADIFETAQGDNTVRCVVVRGSGVHLSAGGDIGGFGQTLQMAPSDRSEMFRARLTRAARMVRAVLSFDRPIITVHRGAAAGAGLVFATAADIVVADETATFVFAHQKIALPPDAGVSFVLPRVVGWRTAKRLILTAAKVDAEEAVRIGLLESLTPADQVDAVVNRLAAQFARAPQVAMTRAKALLNGPALAELDAQLAAETEAIAHAVGDPDFEEGVTAFLEKRRAVFPSAT